MNYASFGTISHGTLRTLDLLDSFANELARLIRDNKDYLDGRDVHHWKTLIDDAAIFIEDEREDDLAVELVQNLEDALNEFAPPYGYFGTNVGDGADFGFWLYDDFPQAMKDDGVEIVSDLSELPEDFEGECAIVNDHGNVSYGYVQDGEFVETWSVV